MKWLRQGLAATAAIAVVSALSLQSSAVAAPPIDAPPDDAASAQADYLPNPPAAKRQAAKLRALEAVASGTAQVEERGRSTGVMVDGQFVETAVTGEDDIFVILTEFGDQVDPRYGGEPGPSHNEIAEPLPDDNSTIWQEDYNRDHYLSVYGETEDDSYPSLANYVEEQSTGRYTVRADVTDWVELPFNMTRYGSGEGTGVAEFQEVTWAWVVDSVNTWWDANCTESLEAEAACNERLALLDIWDRYDYDLDGNFDEPDGYLDHFQLIHAAKGEETCFPDCDDNIWSHRWYVNVDQVGFTGPTVPGTDEQNLGGGQPIGDSPFWVGDYTAQPENGGLGVFAHEYMHDLELPDEYATDGIENDTGWWTLMSQGSYFSSEGDDQTIGDRAAGLNAWDKAFLGWLSPDDGSLYIAEPGEQEITLGPATPRSGDLPQAAVINLPDREITVDTPDPFGGIASWWSFYGDNLDNSLVTTDSMDLSGATEVGITAQTSYDIEAGFDYAFAEATVDDPASGTAVWTRLNGTVDGEPIWTDGEVEGLDGTSGDADGDGLPDWVPLTYDMSAFAGEAAVSFRFSYVSDGGVAPIGFFFDDLSITADGAEVFADDAESEGSGPWTADGFIKAGDEYAQGYPQRYWVENRQLSGADIGFDNSPYNFYNPFELPDTVEKFSYQTGPLIWYNWDAFTDNNSGAHPGVGLILPVDVQAAIREWEPDGTRQTSDLVRPRVQSFDATLSLDDTEPFTLRRPYYTDGEFDGVTETTFESLRAVSVFDDVAGTYWYEDLPNHGVILDPTGTQVELLSMNEIGDGVESATLRIGARDDTVPTSPPPSPTPPTPTLPPTGAGDSSSSIAGIGLASILAGGLLVAFAARRLRRD